MLSIRFAPFALKSFKYCVPSILGAGLALGLMSSAQAATIVVNSASDTLAPAGACSLRGAVDAINNGGDANGCTAAGAYGSGDAISFAPALAGSVIPFSSQIQITKSMVIDGGAGGASAVTLDGQNMTRLLYASSGSALTISHLVLRNGNVSLGNNGGAVYVSPSNLTLRINSVVFANNLATGGGAVYAAGNTLIDNSTFSNNRAVGNTGGGALYVGGNTLVVNTSAFSGNTTIGFGGAIYTSPGGTINNSTFSANSTTGFGGAIYFYSPGTVNASTFSANSASYGGAIMAPSLLTATASTFVGNVATFGGGGAIYGGYYVYGTYLTLVNNTGGAAGSAIFLNTGTGSYLKNSLIAGNAGVTTVACAVGGGAMSSGTNIEWRQGVGNQNSCASASPVVVPGGLTLAQIVSLPLADNGGPTQTLALPDGSPAIDAGDPAVAASADQRGYARPYGIPDLGAFEVQPPPPPVPASPPTYPVTQAFVTVSHFQSLDLTGITGLIAPEPGDLGQQGAYFIFAYLPPEVTIAPDTVWYLDSSLNWHLFADCRATPSYFTGDLQVLRGLPVIPVPADLSLFKGTRLYFGYGVGGYAAPSGSACNDMLARRNTTLVYTVE